MTSAKQIYLGSRRGPALPYDAEVEYLESTGTQWIDTGVVGIAQGMQYEIKYRLNLFGQYTPVFGNYNGEDSDCVRIIAQSANNGMGYATIGGKAGISVAIPLIVGQDYIALLNLTTHSVTVNGTPYSVYSAGTGNYTTIGLFSNRGTGSRAKGTCRIYYFLASKNSSVARYLVPVRFTNEFGKSEGAMYDRVSGQLFRNSGTGVFVFGTDIAGGYKWLGYSPLRFSRFSRLWKEAA